MTIDVKICGITDMPSLTAAIEGDAAMVGFMFYRASPRHILLDRAVELADAAAGRVARVGVFVDPGDRLLDEVLESVGLDYIQLHGTEDAERVFTIKARYGRKVIKAVPIAGADDIARARGYETTADMLLFDAKAPPDALPGGNARAFDWRLIAGEDWGTPWMLSGGLTAENVAEAVAVSGARRVDVSSGVERERGFKDPDKIRKFLNAVARLEGH